MIYFFKELFRTWSEQSPAQLAAALAYYGIFSFAPVIYVGITIANLFFSSKAVNNQLYNRLGVVFTPQVIDLIKNMVGTISPPSTSSSIILSIIGIGAILFAAAGLFNQLKFALNKIWDAPPPENSGVWDFIKNWLLFFVLVIGVGLILILLLFANVLVSWLGSLFGIGASVQYISPVILFGLLILYFGLLFKILPNVKIAWRDVWIGAFVTAVLVVLGGGLVGIYFRLGKLNSAAQAAGGFAVLLIGIYYIAQIFLLGAIFTRVYSGTFGSKSYPLS